MLFGNGVLNAPHLTPGTYLGHLHWALPWLDRQPPACTPTLQRQPVHGLILHLQRQCMSWARARAPHSTQCGTATEQCHTPRASPSIQPGQPWGGGSLRPVEQQQNEVPVWDRALMLLLPGGLSSHLSLPLWSHFFLPVIYCFSAESRRDTAGAHIKLARLSHTCRRLRCYSWKPESKGRWQQARDKGQNQAASDSKESFCQSTG